jgi:hypothetical protein
MELTPEEARRSLDAIEGARSDLQQAFDRQSGRIILGWGIAYLFGPLCMFFMGESGVIPLQLLLVVAIAYTIYESSRKSMVKSPAAQAFGAAWGVLFFFGAIWFAILTPFSHRDVETEFMVMSAQMWAYGVTLAMFAYVVMGLFMGRIYFLLGGLVTVATVVGLFFRRDWYWVWCGFTGGGVLLLGGAYLLRKGTAIS